MYRAACLTWMDATVAIDDHTVDGAIDRRHRCRHGCPLPEGEHPGDVWQPCGSPRNRTFAHPSPAHPHGRGKDMLALNRRVDPADRECIRITRRDAMCRAVPLGSRCNRPLDLPSL
jgi:hypothetical protein